MFNLLMMVFMAVLFFIFTPRVFFSVPGGSSVLATAFVHACLFAVAFVFLDKMIRRYVKEGFRITTVKTYAPKVVPSRAPKRPGGK